MNSADRNDYGQCVPAARRAMSTLEWLAHAPNGGTLTDLSRAIAVSPSSLLALLATLRTGGYVTRGADDRYRVGPALAALGAIAAARLDAGDAFRRAADPLVEAFGDTVLLWSVDGDEAVVVAAREGWRDLRVVPRIGQRVPVADTPLARAAEASVGAGIVGALEPGTAVVAIVLDSGGVGAAAVLGVVGPTERMRDPALIERVRLAAGQLMSPTRPDDAQAASSALTADELAAFLAHPLVAVLAFHNDAGYPSTVPVWYEWDGRAFWLVPGRGARWVSHLGRDPRVSLTVSEVEAPLRRVNVEGLAHIVADTRQARRVRDCLRERYGATGGRAPAWSSDAAIVRIDPARVLTWRGLSPKVRVEGAA